MAHLLYFNIGERELTVILFILLAPAIYCLIDILNSKFNQFIVKPLWILLVFIAPILGPVVYLVIGRHTKIQSNAV